MNRDLINDRMNETQKLLAGFGCSPGDYQMAVAAMTAMLTKPRKKQNKDKWTEPTKNLLLTMPAAGGKTRVVIAAIVYLALTKTEPMHWETIVIIHPNELTKLQDEEQWEMVEALLLTYNVKLERYASFAEAREHIHSEVLVIADEFDYQFIDKARFDPFHLFSRKQHKKGYRTLIAVTATVPDEESILQRFFKRLDFRTIIPDKKAIVSEKAIFK